MMDKMTDEAEEKFREPILALEVSFFVRLASFKLMNEHLSRSDAEIAEDVVSVSQGKARSIAHTSSHGTTVRGSLIIERELKRVIEAYNDLTKDKRWNR